MSNNCKPQNPTKMKKNYQKITKNIMINGLVVILAISGLTAELCPQENVEPGKKRCLTEITLYYANANGYTQPPDYSYDTIDANQECPKTKENFKQTPADYRPPGF